jgi:hypothetical protein
MASEAQEKQELQGTVARIADQRREENEQHKADIDRVEAKQKSTSMASQEQDQRLREEKIRYIGYK